MRKNTIRKMPLRGQGKKAAVLALVLAVFLACGCGSSSGYEDAFNATGENLYETVSAPVAGSTGGEWTVIGLARSGFDVEDAYYDDYVERTEDYVKQCKGVLNTRTGFKYTEYSRIILGFTAVGADVEDVGGYNFLEKLTDMENVCRQGINGPIWALIAYDSGDYTIPSNKEAKEQTSRETLIRAILDGQLADGGWDIAEASADADMTAMALQALAPYYTGTADRLDELDDELLKEVEASVENGLDCLSSLQQDDGGFSSMGSDSSESCSQVIVALSSLGIDLAEDERFLKEEHTVLDALLAYYDGEGGFYHTDGEESANLMATEQAYYAMTAYDRFEKGESPLYAMKES